MKLYGKWCRKELASDITSIRSNYITSYNIELKFKQRQSNIDLKGSFTYYVITKGEGGFGMITLIFALSNAEFDYGRGGEGV